MTWGKLIFIATAALMIGLAIVGARAVIPSYAIAVDGSGENVWRLNRATGKVSFCSPRRALGGIEKVQVRCSAWGP